VKEQDDDSPNSEGQIVIEATPYSTGPQKLLGARQWKKKDK
jgi:hypothetical protein